MPKPRVAVIGYGFAGRCFHSYLVGLVPGLELRGIASRSAETREKIKAERRCLAYESFEHVLGDDQVDLVVLATPNSTHCEMACAALEAGKHVVTDKVICLNTAEADRMLDTAARTGRMLSVFQNRRWDGDYLTVRTLIDEGKIGRVRRIEMAWASLGMWGGWRGQRAMGGGKLYDLGAHLLDQLCQLMPQQVTSVYAKLQYDSDTSDTESDAVVTIGFEDGATAIIETSSICAIPKPRFYITGSGGTFIKHGLDPQERAMIDGNIDAARERDDTFGQYSDGKTRTAVPTLPGRWRSYYEDIAAALVEGRPPAVTAQSVRRSIALFDAIWRSAAEDGAVKIAV